MYKTSFSLLLKLSIAGQWSR